MPSEMVDHKGLPSSSIFSEEVRFPNERRVGFWKAETKPDSYSGASEFASALDKQIYVESLKVKNFKLSDSSCMVRNQNDSADGRLEKYVVGAERAASHSFGIWLDHQDSGKRGTLNVDSLSYCKGADGINVKGAQYENGLFSSSLSELFSGKLRLTSTHANLLGHSVGAAAASHYEEEESLEPLKEIEAQIIGNLLSSDDDLLPGVTDGLDYLAQQPDMKEEIDDLDLFSSVGGLDLGEGGFSGLQLDSEFSNNQLGESTNAFVGKNPYGEHPSRTLFVRNIDSNVEDSELQTLFQLYGDIRTLYTACKHQGFVVISYYDIRAARNAMRVLHNKPLRHRKLDIHFSILMDNPSEQEINQGAVVVSNLESSVSNEELHKAFSAYGEIKEIRDTVQGGNHKVIEYYDIRAAEAALHALDRIEIAGRQIKIEAACTGSEKWSGTTPFPLDSEHDGSGINLQKIQSPSNSTPRFFGPISGMSYGRGMTVGVVHAAATLGPPSSSPFVENMFQHEGGISFPSSVPKNDYSLVRVESPGNPPNLPSGHHHHHSHSQSHGGQVNLGFQVGATPSFHPLSLPDYNSDGLSNGATPCISPGSANIGARPSERIIGNHQFHRDGLNGQHSYELNDTVFGRSGNGDCPKPGYHYMWGSSLLQPQLPPAQGMMWPNSPTFVNGGFHTAGGGGHPSPRMHAIPGAATSLMLNPLLPSNNHHVGSAPSVNPSLWDRRLAYAGGESPDTFGFHPGSLGSMRMLGNSPHHFEFLPQNMFPCNVIGSGDFMDMATAIPSSKNVATALHHRCMMVPGRGGQMMIPMMSSGSPSGFPIDRGTRSRRNEGNSNNQADNSKKQFELDLDRIMRGDDKRTTLMIKNIPNKYTSKMLLAAIDERHRGTYDFIYLPIDFKNKCNVGYAFVNMTDPAMIIPLYQAFNGKKWEKFNSEKVASLAYARIQGKAALIAHFQNSSLMNEDKRCRPILFNTDGPNAGDQVPFPIGVNVRPRPNKTQATASNENYQGSVTRGEELTVTEDSVPIKDSD